jgi:hypothetical protein
MFLEHWVNKFNYSCGILCRKAVIVTTVLWSMNIYMSCKNKHSPLPPETSNSHFKMVCVPCSRSEFDVRDIGTSWSFRAFCRIDLGIWELKWKKKVIYFMWFWNVVSLWRESVMITFESIVPRIIFRTMKEELMWQWRILHNEDVLNFLRSSGSGTGSTQPHDDNWGAISRKWRLRSRKPKLTTVGEPLRWPRDTLYPLKLALTSPTSGGRSVGRYSSLADSNHGV